MQLLNIIAHEIEQGPKRPFVNSTTLTANAFTCPACKLAKSVKTKRRIFLNGEPVEICAKCYNGEPACVLANLKVKHVPHL